MPAPDMGVCNEFAFEAIPSTLLDLRETGCVRCVLFDAFRLCHSEHCGMSQWGVIEDFLQALDTRACNEIAFEAILSTSPDWREKRCVRFVSFTASRLSHSAPYRMPGRGDFVNFVPPR